MGAYRVTACFPKEAFDPYLMPDFDREFINKADLEAFAQALNASSSTALVALNDWRPIHQRARKARNRSGKERSRRSKDETREGFVYNVLKWPILLGISTWIVALSIAYLFTRLYIWSYERLVTWRGRRQTLRRYLQSATTFEDWRVAARDLDDHLGNDRWKSTDEYAYYDHSTVARVRDQLKSSRTQAMDAGVDSALEATDRLRFLVEACVKNNAFGVENARLYSETYYGTKHLAQSFVDELSMSLDFLLQHSKLDRANKHALAKHLHTNFGRGALCLSGGASFAWYHFGVVKALIDHSLLPDIITGTSGGAVVAALVGTRTDQELQKLLVPALAHRIKACEDGFLTWGPRWWRTGARFDSLEWARHCSWFCRGSTTFREAYERTGRILNVTCVPADPHSPTILTNYLTAPDCVIWSAVLASAAVPGILNPVVLMTKDRTGRLCPYHFGHRWKDGSLRTDIPLKALNLHFNMNFSVVSQVNPHVNLFFFSSRGTVGRPVTHRKGRGWRGGYLMTAIETIIKLDLSKYLKILKHLELLPRPLGQDWSAIWLQTFSGTVTIWPKSSLMDFYYLLSNPSPERLAHMIQAGQQSTFPKLLFIENRMKIERLIEKGLLLASNEASNDDAGWDDVSPPMHRRMVATSCNPAAGSPIDNSIPAEPKAHRRLSMLEEIRRQSEVFFDDVDDEFDASESDLEHGTDKLMEKLP
ncbi:MAG: hypothetical protein Q9220_001458 [cf. Caloplaca sp. 1 TL-2023]